MKLVGERRALAAAILGFYFLNFLLAYIDAGLPLLIALAGVYGLAFFSLVAGYFWARWYSVGVGLFGVGLAALGLWQAMKQPPGDMRDMLLRLMLFLGGTHLLTSLTLWGDAMSLPYDGQTAWREKFHMDDNAVQRLGRSVIRAGASLPVVMIYAFGPRPDSTSFAVAGALVALGLAGVGFGALVKLKTWGVLVLGAAGTLMLTLAGADVAAGAGTLAVLPPALAGALLLSATVPYVAPIMRWVAAAR